MNFDELFFPLTSLFCITWTWLVLRTRYLGQRTCHFFYNIYPFEHLVGDLFELLSP
jgi:hypothetical protein